MHLACSLDAVQGPHCSLFLLLTHKFLQATLSYYHSMSDKGRIVLGTQTRRGLRVSNLCSQCESLLTSLPLYLNSSPSKEVKNIYLKGPERLSGDLQWKKKSSLCPSLLPCF